MADDDGSFGLSHLAGLPISLSYGLVLLAVLVVLVLLRFLFADITVRGGVR